MNHQQLIIPSNQATKKQGGNHLTVVPNSSQTQQISSSPTEASSVKRRFAFKVAPDLISSFRYAFKGVHYAFTTQRNFRIHTLIGTIALTLGIFLQVSAVKMAVIGVTVAFVLVLELINTALESVVDLTVKQTYHDLAKIAKDCAAGAVLIGALAALFVAGVILLPPLLTLIFNS
ncbi:diacylglycerol kinase family protein [Euhalothece natronophila Z-M001]|uniref:Diacylglycerol kinase family protein n=1 Tax=Euhalothece natronophila Z-M001 TaxID=522448 RepID=A0A5B8NNJ7_9CHRO|nr:diacylglycerol kinase family protein [Euhalothece natronophila]QDZ40628.1 diacylglycerol kinase family protein [Euhalothece natronophila Z-M001]